MTKQLLDYGIGTRRGIFRILETPVGRQRIGCAATEVAAEDARRLTFEGKVVKHCLNYVVTGQGWYEDEQGRRQRISAGCFFQRLPFVHHVTRIEAAPYREHYCFFHFDLIEQLGVLGLLPPDRPVLPGGHDPRIVAAFQELERALALEGPSAWPAVYAALVQVLAWTHRRPSDCDTASLEPVLLAAEEIREHPGMRLSLDDLAARFGLGADRFRKAFVRHLGVSPGTFQIRCRLDAACVLLQELPIKQVSTHLGYPDEQSFGKQFKRHLGMTPGAWQKQGL
jgi:AraC-like DNA-binding protein